MIIRRLKWSIILLTQLITIARIQAQNARSYDTNDWIPISPNDQNSQEDTKKATGRVLNLDAPAQKFFPNNDFVRKRPPQQQYLQEIPKLPNNLQQYQLNSQQPPQRQPEPYKFENVLEASQQNQYLGGNSKEIVDPIQYIPQQYVPQQQQQQFLTPPQNQQFYPQLQNLNPQLIAQNPQNLYSSQYTSPPFNASLYQSLNPTLINQEILGAVQNNQNVPEVPRIDVTTTTTTPKAPDDKETVQLLYVPLENLKQPLTQPSQTVFKQAEVPPSRQEKQFNTRTHQPVNHKQNQLQNIEQDFIRQALEAHKLQSQLQSGQPLRLLQTTTTPKPAKRKPHQPPLAVYMGTEGSAEVNDVLKVLKNAKSISVQDNVGPESPQIFVGPSNLAPEGYTKFPLPYLSSIENNRIERKVDQLPFFVAPLSYKTPKGYSKIPLPSPHVGSVVVSTTHGDEPTTAKPITFNQNQIGQYQFNGEQSYPNYETSPKNFYQNQYSSSSLKSANFVPTPTFTPKHVDSAPQKVLPSLEIPSKGLTPNQFNPYNFNFDHQNQFSYNQNVPNYQSSSKINLPELSPQYQQQLKQTTQYLLSDDNFSEEPIKQTTTTERTSTPYKFQNVYSSAYDTPPTGDDASALNQRQQHQEKVQFVNNQFPPRAEQQYIFQSTQDPLKQYHEETSAKILTTTPKIVSSQAYGNSFEQISTTPHTVRTRKRQRGKPSTQTTAVPSRNVYDPNKYTVLEEFSIEPKSTTTPKYATEIETIPANVYKLSSEEVEPLYQENPQIQQHILNQEMLDQQILHSKPEESTPKVQANSQHLTETVSQNPRLVLVDSDSVQNNYHSSQGVQNNYQSSQSDQNSYNLPQINSFLPGLINNLQDQSVKSLLVPNLLVPTTEKLTSTINYHVIPTEVVPEITTKIVVPSTELPKVETTTHYRGRTRGRQRNGGSSRYSTSTSSPTRRTVNRRRPVHSTRTTTTTTERQFVHPTTDYTAAKSPSEHFESTKRVPVQRQRFRTRGRPIHNENTATDRISITERAELVPEVKKFKQPQFESGFQASLPKEPQSFMQFEHTIENQQLITVRPDVSSSEEEENVSPKVIKDYHQINSLPTEVSSTQLPIRFKDELGGSKPVVDIQITHPMVEDDSKEPVILTKPTEESQYVNVQSGGVFYNNRHNEETTTRSSLRARTRTRNRARVTTTTPRPTPPSTTTRTTTTQRREEINKEDDENEEFYGFIRAPNFNLKPKPAVYATTPETIQIFTSDYQTTPKPVIQYHEDGVIDSSTAIHFIGEIRPKYHQPLSTTETNIEPETEAPKKRIRGRIRVPPKKTSSNFESSPPATNHFNNGQSLNEVTPTRSEAQVTGRNNFIRGRNRGQTHFRLPENLKSKTDDEDVEGGNYPATYLAATKEPATTRDSNFQITVDPYEENAENDQLPYSSIYSPKIVPSPNREWAEASALPPLNDIHHQIEEKKMTVDSSEEPLSLAIVAEKSKDKGEEIETTTDTPTTTSVPTETTTKKTSRRRGAWRLVKQKPVDQFETAESQNYQSVINSFEDLYKVGKTGNAAKIEKFTTTLAPSSTTTEGSIFDTFYNMFGISEKDVNASDNSEELTTTAFPDIEKLPATTTTTPNPTFPDEYTELTTTENVLNLTETKDNVVPSTTVASIEEITQPTTLPVTETTKAVDDIEPWGMKTVVTSTSTEISHETEICYKGRCVKSFDKKPQS